MDPLSPAATATVPPPSRFRRALRAVAAWRPFAFVRRRPVLTILLLLLGATGTAWTWAATCGLRGCPSDAALRAYRPPEGGRVLDRQGRLIGALRPVRRISVPLARIPRTVQLAFIAVEDRRFYEHGGLDWHGAARAFVTNVRHLEGRQGSSTLTMQAARSAFLSRYEGERSLRRKLIELHLARRLEGAMSKAEILELYLNTIYLGDGTYGVEAASRHYFGKPASRLTLAEGALLAGLPRAPSYYHPRSAPARARARRDLVLTLMEEQGFIPRAAAARARATPLRTAREGWRPPAGPSRLLDLVRGALDSLLGPGAWRERDLVVHTTFDLVAQRAAERAVQEQAATIARARRESPGAVQGALVALDPASGALRAVVGAAAETPGGLNRAFAARRQPGSAFKPFVFAAALERGYEPFTPVEDEPIEIRQRNGVWRPANHDGTYYGTVHLQEALAHSLNAATVRVSQSVGLTHVASLAHRAGITSPLREVPSLALGSEVVTPLELVRAYATFGNGGWRVTPHFLLSVRDGGALRWRHPTPTRARVMDERDAFLLTNMLQAVVDEGTGYAVRAQGVRVPVAGKTGTTNDGADVWFVGYTRSLVAGVWFGYDTPRSLGAGASGGRYAAPAWAAFYRRGWTSERDQPGWEPPPGVEMVDEPPDVPDMVIAPVRAGMPASELVDELGTRVAAELRRTLREHAGELEAIIR